MKSQSKPQPAAQKYTLDWTLCTPHDTPAQLFKAKAEGVHGGKFFVESALRQRGWIMDAALKRNGRKAALEQQKQP